VDLVKELPRLLPLAIAWAETTSAEALSRGTSLNESGIAIARRVGVREPDRIRVVVLDEIPVPQDPTLRQAAIEAGLLGPRFGGLTLGYAIFLSAGDTRPQLLAHEYRHVAQYESFGSIASFLSTHLPDVATVGYFNSLLEQDARAFESVVP